MSLNLQKEKNENKKSHRIIVVQPSATAKGKVYFYSGKIRLNDSRFFFDRHILYHQLFNANTKLELLQLLFLEATHSVD